MACMNGEMWYFFFKDGYTHKIYKTCLIYFPPCWETSTGLLKVRFLNLQVINCPYLHFFHLEKICLLTGKVFSDCACTCMNQNLSNIKLFLVYMECNAKCKYV